jgi:hypothetical protein
MSIKKIGPDDIEVFTLKTHPHREYSSSSLGVTGSVNLFARASSIEKEVQKLSAFNDATANDCNIESMLNDIRMLEDTADISEQMKAYLTAVNRQSASARKAQQLDIIRFEPSVRFTKDTQRKNVVQNVLYPYYRHVYPTAQWAYTNYHTLNFFTASCVPSNTVLLYPNSASNASTTSASGSYTLSDAFSIEFYINPRYTTDKANDDFKAGTILHLSSSYAVSIVTSSNTTAGTDGFANKDIRGRPDKFKLLLQLSGGADVQPSLCTSTTDMAYFSDDNVLLLNNWHHVVIRWASDVNDKTGSFVVDGKQAGTFVFPSSTIAPLPVGTKGNPDVLCIGNFYEGTNIGTSAQALFFNQNIAVREGLVELIDDASETTNTPSVFAFRHPLNAEIHEVKIRNRYTTLYEISSSMVQGSALTDDVLFYLPPFFVKEAPNRKSYGSNDRGWAIGGVQQTPFFSIDGSTEDPFNVALSFGVGGRMLNLENFVRDFVTKNYARLLHLSGTEIGETVSNAESANSLLYDERTFYNSGSIRKRNVTILPNDNGKFTPYFSLLASGAIEGQPAPGSNHWNYTNDLGGLNFSLISLTDLIPTGTLFPGLIFEDGQFFEGIAGASPEDPGVQPGSVLTIFQRTRDNSSNEVVFFDISNMFYGNRIKPGSLVLTDASITGTNGQLSITLKDDGMGSIYRADCETAVATWNNIGNIFYDEGIIVIKTPEIPFFGKDQFNISFDGEQNTHVLRMNLLALPGEFNSSSNPSYVPVSASFLAHETDAEFVYITGLNVHDENLNVVMKTRLAQPVMKRNSDRLCFRVKLDF